MYRKKYGRMTFSAWLNAEMEQTSLALAIFCGILLGVACIVVRVVCGGPHRMILELGISKLVPPAWLMFLARLVAFLAAGCAAGVVLGYRERGRVGEKYKGCMFFVLLAALELCWYPTLFIKGLVLLATVEAMAMVFLAVLTTVSFLRVSRFSGIILIFHTIWVIYLMLLTCAVMFTV